MSEARLLSYVQAAQVLGLRVGTLYSMVSRREIPHVRLGPRLVRFIATELEAWIKTKRVDGGPRVIGADAPACSESRTLSLVVAGS